MDQPSLYDDDIVTWAEQQASTLRELARRPDLSNMLDWENVAEEIESVGRSQIHAVENLLVQVVAHLLKRISAPSAPSNPHWRAETLTFQATAMGRYEPSMRQRIRWDYVWRQGVMVAEAGLISYGNTLLPDLPKTCPIPPAALLTETFDADAALMSIGRAAKFP